MEQTVLELLALHHPDSSKNTLRSWVSQGRVTLDGAPVSEYKKIVREGQRLQVGPRVRFMKGGLKVVYEDHDLVVIDKPEGMLSVATDFQLRGSAHDLLKRRFHTQQVFPVHRLDRETSGIMVFAYTPLARDGLGVQFEAHSIDRLYMALVEGKVLQDSGTWESYLADGEDHTVRPTSPILGKRAVTHYTVLTRTPRMTQLQLRLETGRKNQVRVHCQQAGHPVTGDKKYGAKTNPFSRLCLHAHSLSFTHPRTQKRLTFTSPVPF